MKFLVIIAAVLLVGASALPQRHVVTPEMKKWHKAGPRDYSSFKTRNLYAHAIESVFRPKTVPGQRLHKQSPKGLRPATTQADDCGIENTGGRVVGGGPASPHQFPWLAAVYCLSGGWFCTGSFVSEDHVMTAAHCVDGCTLYEIRAAEHNVNDGSADGAITISATESFYHDGWNSFTLENDIAMVVLPEPVTLSENVRLSCMPTRSDVSNDFTGEMTTVTGWGKTSDGAGGIAEVVNYAENIPVISNAECNDVYGIITDGHICIDSSGGHGVCSGDSGGPLNWKRNADVAQYTQIGVTSFVASAGCESGLPHGFTRVTEYLDWISDNAGIDISP